MKKSLLFAVLYSVFGLIFPSLLFSQDIHVNCATVNPCTLTPAGGIAWSQVNPTWIFAPSNPASSILIYVHNNNGTSAHTATIKVFQTGFARTTAPTLTANADLWVQDAVTLNSTAQASCNNVAANTPGTPGASGVGTCYVVSMYAAQVAIQVTNTSLQAGSPDTYDLSIVQQIGAVSGPQPGADVATDVYSPTRRWTVLSFPAVSNQATATRAAATGVRHVADCVYFSSGATTAPAGVGGNDVIIRDGASGIGSIIWQGPNIIVTAAAITFGQGGICGLGIAGTAGNAMTAEWRNVITNQFETISLTGYDISQ